jgi:hypothetical protein
MMEFNAWLKRRHMSEDLSDRFKFSGDPDIAGDHERDLKDLIKLLSTKYSSDFHTFVQRLGEERGDQELLGLLKRCKTDGGGRDPWKVEHPMDKDEVVPPQADRGAEMYGGV